MQTWGNVMTETVITVQGSFSKTYPAERADVTVNIHIEGATDASVLTSATKSSTKLRAAIDAVEPGAVAKWASDRLQTWTEKPWNDEGKQLPLVSHARIGFTVRFTDFDALAGWIERIAKIAGVEVGFIAWDLTDSSRTTATAEVRSRAVKDAVAKASVYAQSIGLGTVTATALADPGMLGVSSGAEPSPRMMKAMAATGPELTLKPADIEITATVDARFIAS
jgi:uncharacterized protein YggE